MSSGPCCLSAAEAAAVRAELALIANHRLFDHSKRYPIFLRYVVEKTLDGTADELKERVIGIEAFGRPTGYDASQDPVVRTTAAEVRRRLAQYYQQTSGAPAVRIDIPVGSYVPEFVFPPIQSTSAKSSSPESALLSRRAAIAVLSVAALFPAALYVRAFSPNAIERFWEPFLSGTEAVSVCVGPASGQNSIAASGRSGAQLVTINAATTASRVVGFLQGQGKPFELKPVEAVEFEDLRARPIVAIGGFNNPWTMRATSTLRFRFARTDTGRSAIVDAERPHELGWSRRLGRVADDTQVFEDFAIVARLYDPSTGHHALIVGGIGVHGTSASGEFVTSSKYLEGLASVLPRGWEDRNVELVLATTVTDNIAGPPRLVASHVWG